MTTEPTTVDGIHRRTVLKRSAIATGALAAGVPLTASGEEHENDDDDRETSEEIIRQSADVLGQGPERDVVAEDGASIWRTANEILVELTMPTPEPGSYTYPSEPPEQEGEWWTDEVGDVEAFTLWVFTFNDPDECEGDECDGDDLGDPAGGGAFGVTGFVSEGGDLTLNGVVSTETEPFVMDGDPLGVPLDRPREAEVHLAVAPHGAFDPDMMPEILQTPASPGDVWWIAIFDPPH